ncbi:hypothetical protein JXA02_07105 [candidate division KSB1 bacterium]|nr:hypothetical protein [candidate division KSB1 bacterium]RQW06664.1 MAG: hypothetical protein EH222_08280 [candidate division KSB1 bacterium]
MRCKSVDIRAIVMLSFSLVAVVLLMMHWRRSAPKPFSELARLEGRRIGVIDSMYIHLPFRFMIKMPNQQWRLSAVAHDTTLNRFVEEQLLGEQIVWLLLSHRLGNDDTLATARIGVICSDGAMNSSTAALDYLAELIATYERPPERLKIVQQVTGPAHQLLKGASFVTILPADAGIRMAVWIVAFLPRGDWLYVLRLETTEASYPLLRNELQEIVQRFFPLPTSVHSSHARSTS